MKNRVLIIVDDYGEHEYEISRETTDFIETNSVTLFDNFPIRFNKKEKRLEFFDGEWDVFVPEDCILQMDIKNRK